MVLHQVRVLRQVTLPSLSLGFPTGKMGTILPASPGWCTQQHHRGHRPGHRASVLQVRGGGAEGAPVPARAAGGGGSRPPQPGSQPPRQRRRAGPRSGRRRWSCAGPLPPARSPGLGRPLTRIPALRFPPRRVPARRWQPTGCTRTRPWRR